MLSLESSCFREAKEVKMDDLQKQKIKERSRLARKAAYQKQKALLKEKKDALKKDPNYQKAEADRKKLHSLKLKGQREILKAQRKKIKTKEKQKKQTEDQKQRKEKDELLLALLRPANVEKKEEMPQRPVLLETKKQVLPTLRLVPFDFANED